MEELEQETIRRVLAGEVDRYQILMDRHLPAVLRMTLRITGSMEDAEESAQAAFLRAYGKLSGFREEAAFGTWVYRIAMNCALNVVERRRRDPGWNAAELDAPLVARDPDPEQTLLRSEALQAQEHLLRCLTLMERSAFVLRHLEDQPVADIAEALGVSANTARQTIFRAASKLRRQLTPARNAVAANLSSPQLAGEPR